MPLVLGLLFIGDWPPPQPDSTRSDQYDQCSGISRHNLPVQLALSPQVGNLSRPHKDIVGFTMGRVLS